MGESFIEMGVIFTLNILVVLLEGIGDSTYCLMIVNGWFSRILFGIHKL